MFRHYVISAYRSLTRHAVSFWINAIGLSTGMATSLLILLWLVDEVRTDTFHVYDDRLYQVMSTRQFANGECTTSNATFGLLSEELTTEIPGITAAVTYTWPIEEIISHGDRHHPQRGLFVSPEFLETMSFPLLHGDRQAALSGKKNIVLSKRVAEKLFGHAADAVGKVVTLDYRRSYHIAAVLDDLPTYSSMQFDFLCTFEDFSEREPWVRDWKNQGPRTLALLSEEANHEEVGRKIEDIHQRHLGQDHARFSLIKFSDLYLWNVFERGVPSGGRIDNVRLFSLVAIFIMLIACINFINLSTARAAKRAYEVGVRKAIGAERPMLVKQYLSESMLVTAIAMCFALALVSIVLPKFNFLTGKAIEFSFTLELLTGTILITLFTGLLAGSYPSIYLSSYRAIQVIRGDFRFSPGQLWMRKGLVVFQFWLSIIFIAAVVVVQNQVQYIADKDVGYDSKGLVFFSQTGSVSESIDTYLEELEKLPGVQRASSIGHTLVGMQNYTSAVEWRGKHPGDQMQFEMIRVNYGLMKTVGMRIVEGRSFSRKEPTDQRALIINEAAAAAMGLRNPVGEEVSLWDGPSMKIIGVVENFHFQSLRQKHSPAIIILKPEASWYVMVRLRKGEESATLDRIRLFNDDFNPGFPIEPKFIEQTYDRLYETDKRVAALSKYAAGLAILISCLGLLGLASFTAERRTKEIGIRKALGATSTNIIWLLTSEFTRLIIWAIALGTPVAYFILGHWLDQFEYRIELSILFFVWSGLIAIVISWITLGTQALRTALINPSDCLREE